MTSECKVIPFPTPTPRREPPPVNLWLEIAAWSLSWAGEVCHLWSAMLRGRR